MGSDAGDNIIPGNECDGAGMVRWGRVDIGGWLSAGTEPPGGPAGMPRTDGVTIGWG